jgi:UPF0176 protein
LIVDQPSSLCRQRTETFRRGAIPLPGSFPYDNARPMSVGKPYDRQSLRLFLTGRHPHVDVALWEQRAREGKLTIDGRVVRDLETPVRAGNQLLHTIRNEVEPEVSVDVSFLYEDDALVVLSKPAPLPMHPCGRFNRNSLVPLLVHVFGEPAWHPVHRLDADTTGLVVLAKTAAAATHLGRQFETRTVKKVYLARVHGIPESAAFVCDLPLTIAPDAAGKRSTNNAAQSAAAHTAFELVATMGAESLLTAMPGSGRTNQIRAHLAALGLPIVGDIAYGGNEAFTSGQSRLCLHAARLSFRHPDDGRVLAFSDQTPAFANRI